MYEIMCRQGVRGERDICGAVSVYVRTYSVPNISFSIHG